MSEVTEKPLCWSNWISIRRLGNAVLRRAALPPVSSRLPESLETLHTTNGTTHVMVIFKSDAGYENLLEIAESPEIDIVTVGSMNWVTSLGLAGDEARNDLAPKIEHVLTATIQSGKIPGKATPVRILCRLFSVPGSRWDRTALEDSASCQQAELASHRIPKWSLGTRILNGVAGKGCARNGGHCGTPVGLRVRSRWLIPS